VSGHEKNLKLMRREEAKERLEKLRRELDGIEKSRREMLEAWGAGNKVVKQVIDLALLANNMLKGEELSTFVKRSVELL